MSFFFRRLQFDPEFSESQKLVRSKYKLSLIIYLLSKIYTLLQTNSTCTKRFEQNF